MRKNLIKYFIYMLVLVLPMALFAKGEEAKTKLSKTLGTPSSTRFNINNISTWIYNNGSSDIQPDGNSGFIFPKFSNKPCFFQSGLVWGGKLDGSTIIVSGSAYRQGTRPGRIVSPGTRQSESDKNVRIFRVRRDVPGADASGQAVDPQKLVNRVKNEARDENITTAEVVAQYQLDWNEWPAAYGAPYEDIDKNGSYDPTKDIPGFPGADQTIWFVNNDLDAATMDFMYGSLPVGIEQQVTIWGYNKAGDLGNILFRRYVIINKNAAKKAVTDMYVTMWSDPDNGDASDDFVGIDTMRSLQYIYNAKASDAIYGTNPPAAGFAFLEGPRIKTNNNADTANYKNKKWTGYKNLPITGAYYFVNSGSSDYLDPQQGLSAGATQFYNLMQGKTRNGNYFPVPKNITPRTEEATNFPLSGDPVAGTGYLDGIINQLGDRRMGMASGPFNLAYGDTQEVVVAQIAAGARTGINSKQAITLLKTAANLARTEFENLVRWLNNRRPVAKITLDKSEITWGDSVIVKFDQTIDSDNDKLSYEIQNYGSSNLNETTKTASVLPFGLGKNNIVFIVRDNYSADTTYASFNVNPAMENMEIKFSFIDDSWTSNFIPLINGFPYFQGGDTIFVPLRDKLNRYFVYDDKMEMKESIPIILRGVREIKNGLMYTATNSRLSYFGTVGYLSIFDMKNGYSKILTDYTPGSVEPKSILFVDSDRFIVDYYSNLYKVDFTDMTHPIVTANISNNLSLAFYLGASNNNISFLNYSTDQKFHLLNFDRKTLNQVNNLDIGIKISPSAYKDSLLLVLTYGDTLNIYRFNNFISSPQLMAQIKLSTILPRKYYKTNQTINSYSVSFINGNLIDITNRGEEKYIFDISSFRKAKTGDSPTMKKIASVYGEKFSISESSGRFFMYGSDPTVTNKNNKYSGINLISLDNTTDIKKENNFVIPSKLSLLQNYPNPFNPETTIQYSVPNVETRLASSLQNVTLKVFDILGKEVATLVNEEKAAGNYSLKFDGSKLASGTYFYQLRSGSTAITKKLLLIK